MLLLHSQSRCWRPSLFRPHCCSPRSPRPSRCQNALAHDWAVSRRPHARGDGRSGPAQCVLCRPGGWRCVEERRLWADLEPDLRWPAIAVDRGHCRCAFERECCVCGQRRRTASARSFRGQRNLQIHRRGQDLGAPRPARWRADSRAGGRSARSEQGVRGSAGTSLRPNEERGIYRSTDGGATWTKVLYKDANTGGSDVQIDPSNPDVVYASMWEATLGPWEDGNTYDGHERAGCSSRPMAAYVEATDQGIAG
jgi:hypothetical protein